MEKELDSKIFMINDYIENQKTIFELQQQNKQDLDNN